MNSVTRQEIWNGGSTIFQHMYRKIRIFYSIEFETKQAIMQ